MGFANLVPLELPPPPVICSCPDIIIFSGWCTHPLHHHNDLDDEDDDDAVDYELDRDDEGMSCVMINWGLCFLYSEVCSSKAVFLFIVFETLDNTWVVGGAKSLLVV